MRADTEARQLGSGSSGSGSTAAAGSADLKLHAQLLRYMLPARVLTRSHLPDCLAAGGAGGKGASQLLELLVGVLKGVPGLLLQQSNPACVQMGRSICAATFRAALRMLAQALVPAQQDGCDVAAAAAAMLPWLVLLGCCCLLMGEDVLGGGLCWAAEYRELLYVQVGRHTSVASIPTSILICVEQLTAGAHAAHLSGLGYDLQLLQQQARDLSVAAGEYAAVDDRVAALRRVGTQLKALGQSLCAFAVPAVCNNPLCGNVCGPSEAALVGGRSCLCGGCRVARYCSRVPCQRQHWKHHKAVCKALAAAAGAAAEAGDAAAPVSS